MHANHYRSIVPLGMLCLLHLSCAMHSSAGDNVPPAIDANVALKPGEVHTADDQRMLELARALPMRVMTSFSLVVQPSRLRQAGRLHHKFCVGARMPVLFLLRAAHQPKSFSGKRNNQTFWNFPDMAFNLRCRS